MIATDTGFDNGLCDASIGAVFDRSPTCHPEQLRGAHKADAGSGQRPVKVLPHRLRCRIGCSTTIYATEPLGPTLKVTASDPRLAVKMLSGFL